MSITDVLSKIKPLLGKAQELVLSKDIFIILTIILTAIASFGLGRLSGLKSVDQSITIEKVATSSLVASAIGSQDKKDDVALIEGGIIIGTKSSKKYRFPWCKPLPTESNRVIFKNIAEAKASGYTPVANCKGLE